MPNQSDLPGGLARLNLLTYAVLLVFAVLLLTVPAASEGLGIHRHTALPVAVLFLFDVIILGLASPAIRFKFSSRYWDGWVLGTATLAVWMTFALNTSLVWQVVVMAARFDRAWIAILLLPSLAMGWLGLKFMAEKRYARGEKDSAIKAAPEGDAKPTMLERLERLVIEGARSLLGVVIVLQLVIIAGAFYLITYTFLNEMLANDVVIAPRNLPGIIGEVSGRIAESYLELAWPTARVTLVLGGLTFAIIIPLVLLVDVAMNRSVRRRSKLEPLNDADRSWIEAGTETSLDWTAAQPKSRLAPLVVTPILIFAMSLAVGLGAGAPALGSRTLNAILFAQDDELFGSVLGMTGPVVTALPFMMIGILVGFSGAQALPGLRRFYLAMNRDRVERMTSLARAEIRSALESAARKGWYSRYGAFDPEHFHRRWSRRGSELAGRIFMVCLPIALVLTVYDALWFRSWGETSLRYSGPFEITVHDVAYTDVSRLEVRCDVLTGDAGPVPSTEYAIVLGDGSRFSLHDRLRPHLLDALRFIDTAVRAGQAEMVDLAPDGDRAGCEALLRGRYGDDAAAIIELLR